MHTFQRIVLCSQLFSFLVLSSCSGKEPHSKSPEAYDLNHPETITFKESLREISGISFPAGQQNFVYAIEDERGKIYTVELSSGKTKSFPFGEKGDYEDLACYKDMIYVLNSKGIIILVKTPGSTTTEFTAIKTFDNLLPEGEYEGMCATKDSLYVLCKNCSVAHEKSNLLIYSFKMDSTGNLLAGANIEPIIHGLKMDDSKKKHKVTPSCLAKNPIDNHWYIISSVNEQLMVFNEHFTLLDNYSLNAAMFRQPEGLAFNKAGDMFISNEENNGPANILVFRRKN